MAEKDLDPGLVPEAAHPVAQELPAVPVVHLAVQAALVVLAVVPEDPAVHLAVLAVVPEDPVVLVVLVVPVADSLKMLRFPA